MKLTMRVKEFSKKITLMSTAFVLAVSTLTAAVPFIAADQVSAVNPNGCEVEFSATYQKCVRTLTELNDAIGNTAISQIILDDTIETTAPILITRPLLLNGHDEKIKFIGDAAGWQGNYVVKVFNTTGVRLNSLQLEGGDAGLQVNSSEVSISGNMRFTNHAFGNIELTKSESASVTRAPKLSVASQGTLAGDNNTTVDKPYVWVANNAVNDAVVSEFFHRGLNRTTNAANFAQHWYFANPNLTGVVATVVETGAVFATPQEAITAATVGQTVQLQDNITIGDTAIKVNKQITFDGNGKTITAPTFRGSDGENKNAAIVVSADGATVKNVTIASTYSGGEARGAKHGIVVQRFSNPAGYVNDVTLNNITITGASAGLILNNSGVTVDGISTSGSSWYGIGIDKGANVTVKGVNSHDEILAIKNENNVTSSVTYENGQYIWVRNLSTTGRDAYTLASNAPIATVTVDGKGDGAFVSDREVAQVEVLAGGVAAIKSHWIEVKAPNGTLYYITKLSGANNSETFDLRSAKSGLNNIPLDNNGRLVAGEYSIRYVATDVNGVRNDDLAAAKIKVTVDNTNPTVSATLSSDFIVSNNELPTVTINATDANGIDYVQYKIVRADDKNDTRVGWVTIDNQVPTTLEAAALENGNYILVARAFDNAGNKKSGAEVAFTIDRTISTTVSVSNLQSTTPTLNGTALRANNTPVANEQLTVTVDSIPRTVTTSTTGAWELPLTGVAAGKHDVTVAHASAGTIVVTSFTTTLATVDNGDTTTEEEEEVSTTAGATNSTARFPFAFAQPSVLGDADTNIPESDSNNGAAETKGASDILAQAVDADNTNGEALGLAWYWWLLIAAGVAAFVWWIAALIRRRNAEA